MLLSKKYLLFLFIGVFYTSYAQNTLPIYSDYLSDNVFLLHPSAAGIGNCAKLRVTHRQQWSGFEDAPSLQSLSFHSKISEKAALGGIVFNDRNGFFSQRGVQATYAYHLNFDRDEGFNQLSFGLSFTYGQNSVDESSFYSPIPDPVNSQLRESTSFYNVDVGLAYHFMGTHTYLTVKNILLNAKNPTSNAFENLNLRKYLMTVGYYLGRDKKIQFEPSVMGQLQERTREFTVDFNLKAYKKLDSGKQLWAALSYRQGFDANAIENLTQLTPILGVDYKRYMVSYTYTHQLNEVVLNNGGFHQFTVGMNLFCKEAIPGSCPNINALF